MGVYSPENELIPMGNWASTESIHIKSIAHYDVGVKRSFVRAVFR